jgi:hypothetical protein
VSRNQRFQGGDKTARRTFELHGTVRLALATEGRTVCEHNDAIPAPRRIAVVGLPNVRGDAVSLIWHVPSPAGALSRHPSSRQRRAIVFHPVHRGECRFFPGNGRELPERRAPPPAAPLLAGCPHADLAYA